MDFLAIGRQAPNANAQSAKPKAKSKEFVLFLPALASIYVSLSLSLAGMDPIRPVETPERRPSGIINP